MINRKCMNAWMVAIASLVLVDIGQAAQAQSPYLQDNTVNLGSVHQGKVVEHRFMVHNPGRSTVKLGIAGLSHPGMKVRMPQELSPEATGWITVTWDTRLVQGEATAEVLLHFDETEPVALTLIATVIPPVDILPYPAVFISGFRDEGAARTLEIVNNDPAPLNVIGISGENPNSARSYSAAFTTIEPGRRHQLRVELTSAAPAGRSQDVMLVLTDHARFPVIRVPVNLLVKDDVYINPESVDFGQIISGAASQESFLLKTRGGPIKVLAVTSDLPFLRVTRADPDAAASTHEFSVRIEGELARGPFSGSIHVRTDDPSFPEVKTSVQGEVLR